MSHPEPQSPPDTTCVVCFKTMDLFSVGICDHPVCYECSTRMRVICNQLVCPICRRELPKVIFTKTIEPFPILLVKAERANIRDRKYGVDFISAAIQRRYYQLLEHECSICKRNGVNNCLFRTFHQLKDHMRKHHDLFYCDLCVANLRIFTFERKCYTRAELGTHRRKGDADNTSHRGHPLCEFCDERFVDKDELFRHMRRDHYYCHFCDADGKHHYYNTYNDLRKHYIDEHYLCEEGDCRHEKFTSVFRTDIDLKAHTATTHGRNMGKAANRQARTLELEFTLAPRGRMIDVSGRGRRNAERLMEEAAAAASAMGGYGSYSVEPGGREDGFHDPLNQENFPTLDASAPAPGPRANVTITSRMNSRHNEDFPSLGGASNNSRPAGVTITTSSSHFNPLSRENFPTLGKGGKRAPAVTITRTLRQQQQPQQPENVVSARERGATSTVRLSVNSDSSKPNVSIHVNPNPSRGGPARPKTAEAFPALTQNQTMFLSQPTQWLQQKPKKPQEPKVSKVAPAPVLPSRSDFPTLSKKEEAKTTKGSKKNETDGNATTSSWVNLNSFNLSESNVKGKKPPAKPCEEVKQVESTESKTKKKKNKPNATDEDTTRKVKEKNDANLPNGLTNAKKRSELKIGALEINDTDYPTLGTTQPPPPGFNVKPPPGFTNHDYMSRFVNGDPPPSDLTFTTSSGQSYAIVPTVAANPFCYPPNFKLRNQTLIQKLMELTDRPEQISEFKRCSDGFRNGKLSAADYHEQCRKCMGHRFEEMFYELLVLLPDVCKQQELYRAHLLGGGRGEGVEVCATCKQVVLTKELRAHLLNHTLDNHFPVLNQAGDLNNVWNRK